MTLTESLAWQKLKTLQIFEQKLVTSSKKIVNSKLKASNLETNKRKQNNVKSK